VVGDAADGVPQIGFRVEAVNPSGLDDGVRQGRPVAAGEQPVLAAEGKRLDGALGGCWSSPGGRSAINGLYAPC
jgi:hypothetical protein